MNSFLELAGGDNARIVVIPTASALAGTPELEKKLTFLRHAKVAALSILHTRSRSTADDPAFVKPLERATGVWFTGGFQWRLADTYLGTAVDRLVHSVLDRGGVVGGTSSGAAIMSTLMIRRNNRIRSRRSRSRPRLRLFGRHGHRSAFHQAKSAGPAGERAGRPSQAMSVWVLTKAPRVVAQGRRLRSHWRFASHRLPGCQLQSAGADASAQSGR